MKYALILALFFSTNALAQFAQVKLPTNEQGQVQYQEIVRLADGKQTARQIMAQARSWVEDHYADDLTTEQQLDAENNILFIRTATKIDDQLIRYTLTIEPKYGRYRATLTDLIAENGAMNVPIRSNSGTVGEMERASGSKTPNRKLIEQTVQQQAELYRHIDKTCRDTLASLKQTMNELR